MLGSFVPAFGYRLFGRIRCPSCGQAVPGDRKFCPRCGTYLRRRGEEGGTGSFDWRWLGLGTLIMAGAAFVFLVGMQMSLGSRLSHLSPAGRLLALLSAFGAAFFVGGMLVGRMSAGVTLREPGLAGALACVLVFGAARAVVWADLSGTRAFYDLRLSALLLLLPLGVGLAYLGGWVGEKWQGTI